MNFHRKKFLLLFIVISHCLCAILMKTPQEKTPERFRRITIETNDKVQLQVNRYENGGRTVVVIAHGFMQSNDTKTFRKIAESFLPEFDVISIDFRGHGKSGGRFYLTAKETGDLISVLNYAKARYERIGVIGFSLGEPYRFLLAARQS